MNISLLFFDQIIRSRPFQIRMKGKIEQTPVCMKYDHPEEGFNEFIDDLYEWKNGEFKFNSRIK